MTASPSRRADYGRRFRGFLWRPQESYLPVYGVSVVFESLLHRPPSDGFIVVPEELSERTDYELQTQKAAVTIKTWCRGLVDVEFFDHGSFQEFRHPTWGPNREPGGRLGLIKFAHRSIPEFLVGVIQAAAEEHRFDDSYVAQVIFAALAVERRMNYNGSSHVQRHFTRTISRTLHLVRLKRMAPSSHVFTLIDSLETARLWKHGPVITSMEGNWNLLPRDPELFAVLSEDWEVRGFPKQPTTWCYH